MSEEKERKITHKLLALWTGREKEWLTYKQIVSELKRLGISERTVVRYLSTLTRERKLIKEERGYKKTFYRPDDDFLETLYPSLDWIRIHEESLSRMVRDVIITKFERAIINSKETDERIEKLISEEIDKIPKETPTEDEVATAIYNVLSREKLTETDSKILVSLVKRFLFEAFYRPLSNPYGCAGTIEPHVLISSLENDIRTLLSAYMDLWSFTYRVPGASFKFEKYIKERFPSIKQ